MAGRKARDELESRVDHIAQSKWEFIFFIIVIDPFFFFVIIRQAV